MNINTDKNAIYIARCSDNVYRPANLNIPVTLELKDNNIDIFTHMSTVLPKLEYDRLRETAGINKNEKIVYIFCWDTKWNRDASEKLGLFTDVYKILQQIE